MCYVTLIQFTQCASIQNDSPSMFTPFFQKMLLLKIGFLEEFSNILTDFIFKFLKFFK